jgi:6-pyruvoyl tetrahydropterin synthase/QueD family protein
MEISVTKQFSAETAHFLKDTETKGCLRLHGHSYKILITVRCLREELVDGMVVDFSILSKWVKENIISKIDHQLLVPSDFDQRGLGFYMKDYKYEEKVIKFDPQPTAEAIAMWIFDNCKKEFPGVYKVRVYETENSYAEVKSV